MSCKNIRACLTGSRFDAAKLPIPVPGKQSFSMNHRTRLARFTTRAAICRSSSLPHFPRETTSSPAWIQSARLKGHAAGLSKTLRQDDICKNRKDCWLLIRSWPAIAGSTELPKSLGWFSFISERSKCSACELPRPIRNARNSANSGFSGRGEEWFTQGSKALKSSAVEA